MYKNKLLYKTGNIHDECLSVSLAFLAKIIKEEKATVKKRRNTAPGFKALESREYIRYILLPAAMEHTV